MTKSNQSTQTAQSPLISIITIVYNDIAHIIDTMDSVVGQDYPHIEYIIIDGASSDGTREKIMEYIASCAKVDSRGNYSAAAEHIDCHAANAARKDSIKVDSSDNAPNLSLQAAAPAVARQSTKTKGANKDSKSGFYATHLEATHREKNLTFKFLSEQDSGIYDAMNKGIELATGQWCNFMNCGDRFYSPNTLKEFFAHFLQSTQYALQTQPHAAQVAPQPTPQPTPQILYGDAQLIYDEAHSKILYASTKPHKYHHHFIHQSAFIATPLMRAYRYDTGFKIAGDTDFFAKAYNNGARFHYVPLVVASFSLEGISSHLSWQMFKEDCQIGYKYNRLFPLLHALKYLFWIIPRVCIRELIPARFRSQARILLGKKTS